MTDDSPNTSWTTSSNSLWVHGQQHQSDPGSVTLSCRRPHPPEQVSTAIGGTGVSLVIKT